MNSHEHVNSVHLDSHAPERLDRLNWPRSDAEAATAAGDAVTREPMSNPAAPMPGTAAAAEPVSMTHAEMTRALDEGTARHLSPFVTDFVAYAGHWWLQPDPDARWIRVNDPALVASLNHPRRWIED